jgi:hypothetical protein
MKGTERAYVQCQKKTQVSTRLDGETTQPVGPCSFHSLGVSSNVWEVHLTDGSGGREEHGRYKTSPATQTKYTTRLEEKMARGRNESPGLTA